MTSRESYRVFCGSNFSDWQALLKSPGGDQELAGWETDDPFAIAYLEEQTTAPAYANRWRKAQTAEAAFWRTWRENVIYQHVSLEAFWAEILEKTGGPLPPGRILDVGCGPVSVLNFFRNEQGALIGLDPLGGCYVSDSLIEHRDSWAPIPIIELPAEALPFADETLDHLICFNVLDHVSDAPAVLAEMRRVLKPGGSLRVYVHTFAGWIKRFLFFDRPHTYHWDHAEFTRLVERSGFQVDHALEEPKSFDLPSGFFARLAHFHYWVATKVAATSYFLLRKPG